MASSRAEKEGSLAVFKILFPRTMMYWMKTEDNVMTGADAYKIGILQKATEGQIFSTEPVRSPLAGPTSSYQGMILGFCVSIV